MSKLTNIAASFVLGTAALIGSAKGADYVTQNRWGLLGAGHTITRTHTELQPRVVYSQERFCYTDQCGNIYQGIKTTPRVCMEEVVTSQCTNSHIDLNRSIWAVPGIVVNGTGKVISGIGVALTPKGRGPGITYGFVQPRVEYVPLCVPAYPKTCAPAQQYVMPPQPTPAPPRPDPVRHH